MKKVLLLVLVCNVFFNSYSQVTEQFLTIDIMEQVYLIKVGNNTGSAFIIRYNNEPFIVTAKHILVDENDNQPALFNFEIYHQNELRRYSGMFFFHEDKNVDIAVVKASGYEEGLELIGKYIWGSDLYILGFPNNLNVHTLDRNFPILKKGIVSAIFTENIPRIIYSDIVNNRGYSGAPAMVFDYEKNKWCVAGVVEGKLNNPNPELEVFTEQGFTIIHDAGHIREIIESID